MNIQIPIPAGALQFAVVFLIVFLVLILVAGIALYAFMRVRDEYDQTGRR